MMEFNDEKTIHLFSNAQPTLFPENRANDFTNCLEPPLRLPHGDQWEVGLKEFSCVNTLQTISRDVHFHSRQGGKQTDYTLAKGMYNEKTLVAELNQNKDAFEFSYQTISKDVIQIKVQTKKEVSLCMEPLLADILGLDTKVDEATTRTATSPLHLKAFSYNIVVYCDLVEESIVGGQREKILRVIPFRSGNYYDVFHREFYNIDYVNVTAVEVAMIRMRLMTDYGEELPLRLGRTFVSVHFRRKHGALKRKLSNY